MQKKSESVKPTSVLPDQPIDRSWLAKSVAASRTFACSQPDPIGPAQCREVPEAVLQIEPQPLSAYDDNPVLNETGAAFIVGVTADCLKKWRQRKQGPDHTQYGRNGPVRYELEALMKFRDKHRVKLSS